MKFTRRKKDLPKVDPVKIKPLFGLRPGLWLTIAYTLALLAVIFLVCMLPDIINGTKRVTFESAVGTAAVYVDDVYQGGTPFTRKIASGTHNVSYRVNGQEIDSLTLKVGHPVFLNWLFPRTQTVTSNAQLTEAAFEALTAEFLQDVSSYSAILEYDSAHRYPEIFTSYANAIAGGDFRTNSRAYETATMFLTTDEMYEDAVNAENIIGINLLILYPQKDGSKVGKAADSPALKATKTSLSAGTLQIEGFSIPEADFVNGRVTDPTYPEILEAGTDVHTDAFNIGAYCITEYQYAVFVSKNPKWAASNKASLITEGLVDDYYLSGITLSTTVKSTRPIRNISWNAAQAFCRWLSDESGKNVYLPSQDQWTAAALTDQDMGFQKSLVPSEAEGAPSAMLGGVWEMTSSPVIPLARIFTQDWIERAEEILEKYDVQTDMVVKGGSYISNMSDVDIYTVGTTYRSLCSDFMGFRIAWN